MKNNQKQNINIIQQHATILKIRKGTFYKAKVKNWKDGNKIESPESPDNLFLNIN